MSLRSAESTDPATVAVVIPAYNAADRLGMTLRSVLAQTRPPDQVIVVDDGSTDDTALVAESFGPAVRCIRKRNGGVSQARNEGIAAARADFVAFLDADDLFAPTKLERQLQELAPGVIAVSSGAVLVDDGLDVLAVRQPDLPGELLVSLFTEGNLVGSPSSALVSRRALDLVGGFDERLSFTADWDLWIRLARAGEIRCAEGPLIAYRLHDASMSSDAGLVESDSIAMLERALAHDANPAEVSSARGAILARQWSVAAGCHLKEGSYVSAARCLVRGAASSPSTQYRALAHAVRRRRHASRRAAAGDRLGQSAHVRVDEATERTPGVGWLRQYRAEAGG